jgi:hypothetical protein
MKTELERCGRKRLWCNLQQYLNICLEGLRKITNNQFLA